ncbi:serine protease [Pedobacter aquatilis]|uniref:S1 family peptidase n=1 Tax=Pedobacter aquatilis TaxID=351343 RepID=UPI0029301F9F|nr:serine protease [Pedobacter aquatilis]
MSQAYFTLLQNCCAKIFNGKQGTAFFVSPTIAFTCAHVIAADKNVGDRINMLPFGSNINIEMTILAISRDSFQDYCILEVASGYQSKAHVLPASQADPLQSETGILGTGFSMNIGEMIEGFSGIYEAPIAPANPESYPFGFCKVKNVQLVPGMSGSPVISSRTGKCIGVLSKTRDKDMDIGGWVIPIAALMAQLSDLGHVLAISPQINEDWALARAAHFTTTQPEIQQTEKLAQVHDEAYTCDRVHFSAHYKTFENYSQSQQLKINHLLIVGKSMHSPVGLARKLIYEQIARNTGESFYPSNPRKAVDRIIKLKVNYTHTITDILADLKKLYIGSASELAALSQNTQLDLTEDLISAFNRNKCNIHILNVTLPEQNEDQHKLFALLRDFTLALAVKEDRLQSKVFFFWCLTTDSSAASSILKGIVKQQFAPNFSSWMLRIPIINNRLIMSALKKCAPSDYHLWPLNQGQPLQRPPDKDLQGWIDVINGGALLVDEPRRKSILALKNTTDIEGAFIQIIDEFNANTTKLHP